MHLGDGSRDLFGVRELSELANVGTQYEASGFSREYGDSTREALCGVADEAVEFLQHRAGERVDRFPLTVEKQPEDVVAVPLDSPMLAGGNSLAHGLFSLVNTRLVQQ